MPRNCRKPCIGLGEQAPRTGYECWLSQEPNPRDLLITYPSEPMVMWPISTRVNKPENDDLFLLEPINDAQFDDLSQANGKDKF